MEEFRIILGEAKTIAVVGLSPNPDRPSHDIGKYLQAQGYRIIPANPLCRGCGPDLPPSRGCTAQPGLDIPVDWKT